MLAHLPARYRAALILAATALYACAPDDTTAPPVQDPATMYWGLTLDHRAVLLSTAAPYDTVRLTATPRNVDGEPLAGVTAPVQFRSTDLKRLQVDADGLVHAVEVGTTVRVVATLTLGNVTHADTALITVVDNATPPELTTLSIHPVPPDSAIWEAHWLLGLSQSPFHGIKTLPMRALDASGTPISGVIVDFRSSDTTIATVDRRTGVVAGRTPGTVTITATTTAFGVTKADTLPFTITYPLIGWATVTAAQSGSDVILQGSEITIAAGGIVSWSNSVESATIDLIFEDPTNVAEDTQLCFCGSGNISMSGFDFAARSFPVPGTYVYHSTTPALTGRVVVMPPPSSP